MVPHNLPLTLIGAGILWFGWFGFNAGSALAGNDLAATALINTHLAAAAAMMSWLLVERYRTGHATTLGAASGLVAGLVAITPCAGFVGGMSPIYIGLIAGAVCAFAISLKFKFGYDDSLDVVGVHLVGGIIGSLLVGIFADAAFNPAVAGSPGGGGLVETGSVDLLGEQLLAVVATMAWSFVAHAGHHDRAQAAAAAGRACVGGGRRDRSRPHAAFRDWIRVRSGVRLRPVLRRRD